MYCSKWINIARSSNGPAPQLFVDMDLQICGIRKSYGGCKSSPRAADLVARSFIFHLPSFNLSIFHLFKINFSTFHLESAIRLFQITGRFGHVSLPCMHGSVIPSGHTQQSTKTLKWVDRNFSPTHPFGYMQLPGLTLRDEGSNMIRAGVVPCVGW